MKTLLTLLLATLCAATSYGQTIKSLGYNTTNGQIVAATNVVWTNAFNFSTNTVAAQVRTNMGIVVNALTNTNAQNILSQLGIPFFSFAAIGGGSLPAAFALSDFGDENLYVLGYNADQAQWEIEHTDDFQSALFSTNTTPSNTTNVSAWISVQIGTNSYRVPAYK